MATLENFFNPRVSIVIPVYNGEDYLREAIDSALAQTYKNLEIIVVNDGSADRTEEVARSYGDKIRYFKKENGGAATALNLAIQNMKGDYFSWLSHDDLYYPNKISRQIEELRNLKDKNTIIMSDLDGINENYEKIYKTNYKKHIEEYPPRLKSRIYPVVYNQTHGCTLLIPKACFDKVGLFDEGQLVAQDFEFFYRAFKEFPHHLVSEVLVTARDTSGRVGRTKKPLADKEYSALYISILDSLSDNEIKLLAKSKADFYRDMEEFFEFAGYSIASAHLKKKIMKNLQISSHDLVGNKFNGYDLHLQLRDRGIDSAQMVLYKHSSDPNTYIYNFFDPEGSKKLIQQKIFLDADIVHLHLVHNIIDLNYLPIMSKLKPVMITLHDPFFLGGHCVHHFECNKWQSQCFDCEHLDEVFTLDRDISSLNFELKKEAIQNSNITAIVASRWMKDKVERSPIWRGKKIYLLPFGVDQKVFNPGNINDVRKNLNIKDKSVVIMFRADEGSFKGLDVIKKALSDIKNTKNITLISVGQEGLLKEFKDRFNLIEYGWIKDDNLLSHLYQACDIFLMPSRQETFGMMAIEAMSCGKMVLALESEGSALTEVINSPVCGLAVKEQEYSKELQRLLATPNEIWDRGKKSLEYAQNNYSTEVFVDKLLEIYKEVISDHKITTELELLLNQLKKVSLNELSLGNKRVTLSMKIKKFFSMLRSEKSPKMITKKFIKVLLRLIFWPISPWFIEKTGKFRRILWRG